MPIQSRRQLQVWMRQDLERYIADHVFHAPKGRWRWWHRIQYPVIAWQRLLRRTEHIVNTRRGAFWTAYVLYRKWIFQRASIRLNLEIPLNVFGPGLVVAHYGSIVVNGEARVGSNCRIHPGSCIGELHEKNPVIGNDVYIGNGAIVIGGIRVGDRVKIGPHALVRTSIEQGETVVGSQAARIEWLSGGEHGRRESNAS